MSSKRTLLLSGIQQPRINLKLEEQRESIHSERILWWIKFATPRAQHNFRLPIYERPLPWSFLKLMPNLEPDLL